MPVCDKPLNATNCDSKTRTVNTDAECGADNDWYYFSPWRAPGSAPVFDSCGMAGGRGSCGGFGAAYVNTTHAKIGDLGSETLPEKPTGTIWKAGSTVEVAWSLQANHGGGYQYRLCPKGESLTEECFQKTPLKFVGQQTFKWANGETLSYDGTYVSEGTSPKDSTWAMNPIPRLDSKQTGKGFEPRCKEVPECQPTASNSNCKCSGMWGPYDLEIVDNLEVPSNLPAGEYVLGWRWDCEESTQVWSNCADVTLIK